jgi:hypothetical protein
MLSWLDGPLGLVLIVVLLLGAIGWYLSYLAARLDRLHHRVESSRAALEARLARRSAVALRVSTQLPAPAGLRLAASAHQVLRADDEKPEPPIDQRAENDLTRTLHAAFADPGEVATLRADPATAELLAELLTAGERVELARRFHNDAVAHAQRMRRKRVVRWAKLAGRAALPTMIDIDDSPPRGLTETIQA